jgi:hypothetical protein
MECKHHMLMQSIIKQLSKSKLKILKLKIFKNKILIFKLNQNIIKNSMRLLEVIEICNIISSKRVKMKLCN